MTSGPWAGVRVVELSGLTAAYATRMWAALGAHVVVVEPPTGHALRHLPPFAPCRDDLDASLWWAFFAQGKRSVVAEPGSDERRQLVESADVVIDDVDPRLGRPEPAHDRQVVVAISPFGLTGPRQGWKGSELVAWASSGLAYTFGFPDRPPVGPATPVQFAAHLTSLYALNGAMLALRAVRRTNRGQVVDVSMQECCLSLAPESGVALFLDDRVHRSRPGNRRAVTRPWGLYPCSDGFVSFLVIQPAHWNAMATWIAEETGMDAVLDDAFNDMHLRWEASDLIDELTEQVTRPRTKLEIFVEGQRRGIPTTPVNTVADLRRDPHLQSVGFWRSDHHPSLGTLSGPGAPFRVNHDWWRWTPAPTLGQHTAEELRARPRP
jgi:crotonobetainyl-CoA:carnitine CoA-transferase CaiB-like acyl-CoA transferase